MKQIKRLSVAVVTGAALWGMFGASLAMGLGKPHSHAILGEELSITVPVRLEAGERLDDECVAADVFFGDEKVVASQVRARVGSDADGSPVINVSTRSRVSEPVVTIYVVAGCNARITRKILALADPPGLQLPSDQAGGVVASQPVPNSAANVQAQARVLPGSAVVAEGVAGNLMQPAGRGRKAAEGSDAARGERGASARHAAATAALNATTADPRDEVRAEARSTDWRERMRQARQARISEPLDGTPTPADNRAARAARAGRAGGDGLSRLELDPVAADALVTPDLKMGASMATVPDADAASPELLARRASAAAYWRALQSTPEQLARDQERLQQLEQRVAELQTQIQQGQAVAQASGVAPSMVASVPTATAAASEANAPARVTPWLALAAALGVAVAYVWWRSRTAHQGAKSAWWQAPAHETESPELPALREPARDEQDLHSTTVEFVHVPDEASAPMGVMPAAPMMSPTAVAGLGGGQPAANAPDLADYMPSSRRPGAQFTSMFGSLGVPGAPGDDSLRAVAVEELIDLEQQAEFFVVLGQDDAAIDLLETYVQHNPQGSPLPMLKLLDIYRRLGRREDYERTCLAFDSRFNAHAPGWSDDMLHGHSLADYPEVIERLQALWAEPAQAMAVLEKSLLRPTSGGDTFDLPAYRELLTLYAVARDLAEGVAGAQRVDVLLPLTAADVAAFDDAPTTGADVSPLMATRPVKAQPVAALAHGLSVDFEVDLQLDDEPRRG